MSSSLISLETTFILIRHTETEWNAIRRVQGQQDVPLSERGILQAQTLARLISKYHSDITHIYSSDLSRAIATAEMVSQEFNFAVSRHPGLRELCRGEAEGLNFKDADALYGHWKEAKAPGAEAPEVAFTRMKSSLEEIGKAHPEEKIAIVTHGMLMEIFASEIQGTKGNLGLSNGSIVEVAYSPENTREPFRMIGIFDCLKEPLVSLIR